MARPNPIYLERLANQHLVRPVARDAASVVQRLVAVQAQDYPGAKWALSLRSSDVTDRSVDEAFDRGDILRTHVMRPTWHFVAPQDIRWLLRLTGPRVRACSASVYRSAGLDAAFLSRAMKIIERELKGGAHRTRTELAGALRKRGMALEGTALAYVMMHAELDALICSGPRRGKQFTYALMDERVRATKRAAPENSLRELVVRYFTTRGPATLSDFNWWSGLAMKDARAGIEMAAGALTSLTKDGRTYWRSPASRPTDVAPRALLLPTYDELGISYKDRRAIPAVARPAALTDSKLLPNILLVGREIVGRWNRSLHARNVTIALQPFRRLTRMERDAVEHEVARYETFLGVPTAISAATMRA